MFQLVLSASLALAADQLAKVLVARRLATGQSVFVGSYLQIRHVAKTGVRNRTGLLLLWWATLAGILLALQSGCFFQQPIAQVGLGVALGGATSNFYDRLRYGEVIDFLDIGWWPVFNLADVAITVGAMAALWFIR